MQDEFKAEPWRPGPGEYDYYQQREIMLCRENIALLRRRGYRDPRYTDTLHSKRTFEAAMREVTNGNS